MSIPGWRPTPTFSKLVQEIVATDCAESRTSSITEAYFHHKYRGKCLKNRGGQGRNRTADASLFRAALYQLSYLAVILLDYFQCTIPICLVRVCLPSFSCPHFSSPRRYRLAM